MNVPFVDSITFMLHIGTSNGDVVIWGVVGGIVGGVLLLSLGLILLCSGKY